jgi:hypothetical protein
MCVALCSKTILRQLNIDALGNGRETVSRFSQFLYFPCTFYLCNNCCELFTQRSNLLSELLQRQLVRTRHDTQFIHFHFCEQLVEAVARSFCCLQRFSLQQLLFEHSVFGEAADMSSDMFNVPLFELGHFCCQSIDECVDGLLYFGSLLAKDGGSPDGRYDAL